MTDFVAEYYLWIKAFHIIMVVCWMAGLLYLPRLFVYHAETNHGSATSDTFLTMERKLLRGIMNPSMIAVFILGTLLLFVPGVISSDSGWLHLKLLLVLVLAGYHMMLAAFYKRFEAGDRTKSHVYFRWINEIPAFLLIVIVLLVVVKPF